MLLCIMGLFLTLLFLLIHAFIGKCKIIIKAFSISRLCQFCSHTYLDPFLTKKFLHFLYIFVGIGWCRMWKKCNKFIPTIPAYITAFRALFL